MQQRTFIIQNKLGIHMKPAGLLVREAGKYKSKISVYKNDMEHRKVNAKSLIGVLTLAAGMGSTVTVLADGEDEEQALNGLEDLIVRRKFDEE